MRLEESAESAALEVSSNATGCPELVGLVSKFQGCEKTRDERRNGSQAFVPI